MRKRPAAHQLPTALLLVGGAAAAAVLAPAWAGRPGQELPQPRRMHANTVPPVVDEGFGRWESQLRSCRLLWPGASTSGCLKLRLDQSIEGMLRVRFINAAGSSRYASEELTFAGLLLKQDQPMRCRQAQCSPTWPLRLQVLGVATRRFDGRGLASALPSNQLAKGSCRLGPQQLTCQAEAADGQIWRASAELTGQASSQRPAPQETLKSL